MTGSPILDALAGSDPFLRVMIFCGAGVTGSWLVLALVFVMRIKRSNIRDEVSDFVWTRIKVVFVSILMTGTLGFCSAVALIVHQHGATYLDVGVFAISAFGHTIALLGTLRKVGMA